MSTSAYQPAHGQTVQIAELRDLRRKARQIYRDLERDLQAFQQPDGTFSTPPPPRGDKIHVTTTCTALMALASAGSLDTLCPPTHKQKALSHVFKRVVEYEWKSEGLDPDNAFSVAFVLRAAGFFVRAGKLRREEVLRLKHGKKSLEEIGRGIARKAITEGFSVKGYPPKAAIVYWYVDGIDLLNIDIGADWKELVIWAGNEFARQLAYVASNNDALMDPVSLAMAACLVTRIRKIMNAQGASGSVAGILPSQTEIDHAICLLFKHQTPSGIWPKYFPMFHFQTAGANYCFTFEMLEAVVNEIDSIEIFSLAGVLAGLNSAANWCVLNRLSYRFSDMDYCGWNSGGSITTLRSGIPESWATATVHWFLHKLDHALFTAIESGLLEKYAVGRPLKPDREHWDRIADANVVIDCPRKTVKGVLEDEFLIPLQSTSTDTRVNIETRRSALLFGPPGTAKTTLVRKLAQSVGWPCVEIRPSNFLSKGLENIYAVADEIFSDLMDLSRVVIFFDEMDTLVQSRSKRLDVTRQFLTTSMLPKLAELHDQGQVLFFVATNYRKNFDEAITRPGRFDLLLFVGPPSWSEKLRSLDDMVGSIPLGRRLLKDMKSEDVAASIEDFRKKLRQWAEEAKVIGNLGLFTYGETKNLIEELLRNTGERSALRAAVSKLTKEDFAAAVKRWTEKYIILHHVVGEPGTETFENYKLDKSLSRLQ